MAIQQVHMARTCLNATGNGKYTFIYEPLPFVFVPRIRTFEKAEAAYRHHGICKVWFCMVQLHTAIVYLTKYFSVIIRKM